MKSENITTLLRLSAFCRYAGYIFLGLGLVVGSIDAVNRDWFHLQSGIFMFSAGYALIKIGARISAVLFDERTEI